MEPTVDNKEENKIEEKVQKFLVSFCTLIPRHVDRWRSVLAASVLPIQILNNLNEQSGSIEKANLKYLDEFEEVQGCLLHSISRLAEEQIIKIQDLIQILNKTNYELMNKLRSFEESSLMLDMEKETTLIRGTYSQPPLQVLLQSALEFRIFFDDALQKINTKFKRFCDQDEENPGVLHEIFTVDLNDRCIVNLVAITQYVDNEKCIS